MRIVLLRHGKPNSINSKKIKSAELGDWISQYNSATLDLDCQPQIEAICNGQVKQDTFLDLFLMELTLKL